MQQESTEHPEMPERRAFADRPVPNMVLRLGVMALGMANIAFGIAISRATDLGLAAISSVPGVINYAAPAVSLGTATFVFNVLLVILQIVLLRRQFKWPQLLSIPFVLVFSAMIDLFVPVANAIPMGSYPARLLFCLVSCAFIAFGVWVQAKAALIMLPGDGLAWTVGTVFRMPFGKAKMATDITILATAAVLSLVLMGGLFGVREGSVVAAFLVGFLVRCLNRMFPQAARFIPAEGHITWIPKNDAE